jgi:hypothetical protein
LTGDRSIVNLLLTQNNAIAQAVSRWLPIAAARVRAWVLSCGICGGQSGAGAGFLRVLRFHLPIFIPPIAPQSPSSIIWGLYNRPEVAAVPRDLVPPHKNSSIIMKNVYKEVKGSNMHIACLYPQRLFLSRTPIHNTEVTEGRQA